VIGFGTNRGANEDAVLLKRMQGGDEEAFVTLYRRFQGPVYRFALRMCGSETTAEDVTQEVFLGLIRGLGAFDPGRGTLGAYLYGAARRQVFRQLGANPNEVPLEESDDGPVVASAAPSALAGLERREAVERVRQALAAIPAHYREAVVLCDLEEMPYAEAAAILGCAVGTVRSRLNRARAMLLERLSAERAVA
jgi:RNA polymerase sigma-70 factor (ECF subfamily)